MLRATAAPERFLTTGGFTRFVSRSGALRRRRSGRASHLDLGLVLPSDLHRFLAAVSGGSLAGLVFRATAPPKLATLLASTPNGAEPGPELARRLAWLAGAVPFGETESGELLVYFLVDSLKGVIASLETRRIKPTLVCRGAAPLALMCMAHVLDEEHVPPVLGLADEEAVRARVERARSLVAMLQGSDAQIRSAARALALKPLDVPPPEGLWAAPSSTRRTTKPRIEERTTPLALGALVEAFFRLEDRDLAPRLAAHASSPDAIVRDAVVLLTGALSLSLSREGLPRALDEQSKRAPPFATDLGRRRGIALRSARTKLETSNDAMETTRRLVARFDALPPNVESYAGIHEREETLLALAKLGDRGIMLELVPRAQSGDANAIEMLAALGDRSLVPWVNERIASGGPSRGKQHDMVVARFLAAIGAREAAPALRALLEENPMRDWRDGLERGALVRELVVALGELRDEGASRLLLEILESTVQEYRSVIPSAAWALGRSQQLPALTTFERLLFSPKEPVTPEVVWAVGEVALAHLSARETAGALLDRLTGLDPGVEVTRLTALAKFRKGKVAPRAADLRRAVERAIWEPAFRQEETSRRRGWALLALEELATVARTEDGARLEASEMFLGHEVIRHLVTRDDHRVRKAAEAAFRAWELPVPQVRHYFAESLPELEKLGGLGALLEAVRDPLGVFRHNVATRIAALEDTRAVRPLAEATARLFAEPPTSTYEYDDAPPNLVAFVRALARFNRPEGNDVLIEALKSGNHQVRAVVADNAPDDARFVPELTAMLGDPRSFLRSRAEKSLTTLGAIVPPVEPITTEITAARIVVGR